MPEGLAARDAGACGMRTAGSRVERMSRAARRWAARAMTGVALAWVWAVAGVGVPVQAVRAEGRAPATAPLHPSRVPPPGMSLPGFHTPSAASDGTVARGAVRAQPARMPFYVATKGKVTIYVLGTLHIGDPVDYPAAQPFRPRILAALAASPTLALELSPDDLLESQDDVSKYGVCNYPCLPRLLPAPLWQRLAGRLRGNPTALAEIRKMRPWLAALVVETYDSLSAGLQTEYGTEAQLHNVFLKKRGGKMVGLETLAEQMRAFTGLTLAEQREMLAQDMVQTPAQNADDVKTLHRLWRIGDADALAAWAVAKGERLSRSKTLSDSIDNKIVFERNRRFVARMTAMAAPGRPLFVAIGALHLGGRRGVLELLRQQGYRVDAN